MRSKLFAVIAVVFASSATGLVSAPATASEGFNFVTAKKSAEPQFLPAEEAFVFSHLQQADSLMIFWQIPEGYYLYKDKIKVTLNDKIIPLTDLPAGTDYQDEYFGQVKIFRYELKSRLQLTHLAGEDVFKVQYQGCADAGLCYPPVTQSIQLK